MKIIAVILDIIMTIVILVAIVGGAAFVGWSASASKRISLTDKAAYYYATEIRGEDEFAYMFGTFVDDVTDLFD